MSDVALETLLTILADGQEHVEFRRVQTQIAACIDSTFFQENKSVNQSSPVVNQIRRFRHALYLDTKLTTVNVPPQAPK